MSLVGALAAQGYTTDFEALLAAPAGTPMAGQDLFYVPPVAGSIDGAMYTYAGNTIGIPTNANGGANFWAGVSAGGTAFARSQRPVTLPTGRVRVSYDICCNYIGAAVTPANNIGSFSFQPSTNSMYVNTLAAYPVGVVYPPTTWDANVVTRGAVPPATVTTVLPNPAFQGLAMNVWHNFGVTVDMNTGEHVEFSIKNGVTGITTTYVPATPLLMAVAPAFPAPVPTDFRLFGGGGAGNVFAIDNLRIEDGPATVEVQGEGCPFAHSFYELFTNTSVDVANSAFTMTPTGGGGYVVTKGGTFLPVGSVEPVPLVLALGDDTDVNVPFTLGSFPGWVGLQICSNGFISQAAGNLTPWTPVLTGATGFLSSPQTAFRSWHDFNPSIAASGKVKVEQSAAVVTVTWDDVWNFSQVAGPGSTLQWQFYPSGVATVVLKNLSTTGNGWLVGYSPGGASVDPGNTDLSGLGSVTLGTADKRPLRLTASARPVQGAAASVYNVTTSNIPATAGIHLGILGLSNPNAPLFVVGMPDCTLLASLDVVSAQVAPVMTIPSFTWSPITIPALPPSYSGFTFYLQSVILGTTENNAFGFGALSSNGLKCVVGLQ